MSTAIYPGSFDPVTLGHLDIIKRAARQFDHLIVCVMINSEKHGLFLPEERVELVRRVTADIPNVEVDCWRDLLSEYARKRNATVVVKGLRAVSDYEKECQMALINRKLNPNLDTMFLPARQNFTYLSSSVAKEMARYHVSLEGYVPAEITEDVQKKMDEYLQKSQS